MDQSSHCYDSLSAFLAIVEGALTVLVVLELALAVLVRLLVLVEAMLIIASIDQLVGLVKASQFPGRNQES